MPRSTWQFAAAALIVGAAVDILFWQVNPGLSFLAWTIVTLSSLYLLAFSEKTRPSPWSLVLTILSLGLSAMTILRLEPFTRFLDSLLALALLTLLATTYRTGNWTHYRLVDYLMAAGPLLLAIMVRPWRLFNHRPAGNDDDTSGNARKPFSLRRFLPILRGLLLAFPVVAVMAGLLSSADPIFSDQLRRLFQLERLPEYIFRLLYVLVMAGIACGTFLHALLPDKSETRPDPQAVWFKPFLGWIESAVVLASVNLLFALFVGVQFHYFFGGQANITAAGYTYSDYARRGFAELVAVAVLSLLLHLTLGLITHRPKLAHRRIFSSMTILLLGLVVVMLSSAFQRLLLYEDAYGFTLLRTLPHIFMVWLGILLLVAIILEFLGRNGRFALALLLCGVGFGLTIGLINVDGFIAGKNIAAARQGLKLDASYLAGLSSDAVPVLVEEYRQGELPAAAQSALGANLACRAVVMRDTWDYSWQSLHPSRSSAWQALESLQSELQAYPVRKEGKVWKVKVNKVDQICW